LFATTPVLSKTAFKTGLDRAITQPRRLPNTARAGLTFETAGMDYPALLFEDRTVQNYPFRIIITRMNKIVSKKLLNFGKQAAKPLSIAVLSKVISTRFHTQIQHIYEAGRDLHRARRAEWHEDWLPTPWKFYVNQVKNKPW
jgi:hypothetical protein